MNPFLFFFLIRFHLKFQNFESYFVLNDPVQGGPDSKNDGIFKVHGQKIVWAPGHQWKRLRERLYLLKKKGEWNVTRKEEM